MEPHRLIFLREIPWVSKVEEYEEYDLGDADIIFTHHLHAGESVYSPSTNTFIVSHADASELPTKTVTRTRRNRFRFSRVVSR